MKKIFECILYRVFEHFNRNENSFAIINTINFIVLLQASLLVPLFILINLFTKIEPQIFGVDNRIKYYIGIPLAVFLILLNSFLYKKKLKGEKLKELQEKYHKENYRIPIWVIFSAPVFFVFICPILYGIINGTIHISHPGA